MMVKKSIQKVKNLIHRRLKNLWLLVLKGSNQNQLSKAPSFNAIITSSNTQQVDNFNSDMSEETVIHHNEVDAKKSNSVRSTTKDLNVYDRICSGNGEKNVSKTTKEERVKEENKIGEEIKGCLLAEKMKELEMVDAYNSDHVIDIDEALHYYALITCPVYQDIVDRFFANMYSEFLPQPSASINNSMRRLHSMRL